MSSKISATEVTGTTRTSRKSRTFGLATLLLILVVWTTAQALTSTLSTDFLILLASCFLPPIIALAIAVRRDGRIGPQHLAPAILPSFYICAIMVVPFLYMLVTDGSIGSIDSSILNRANAQLSLLAVSGFYLGVWAVGVLRVGKSTRLSGIEIELLYDKDESDTNYRYQLQAGRALFVLAFGAKIALIALGGSVFNTTYGANQLDFGGLSSLTVLSDLLLLAGSVLVFSANLKLTGSPIGKLDALIFCTSLTPSLVFLGSRGEAIGPLLILFWYASQSRQSPKLTPLIVLVSVVAVIFVGIGLLRSGDPSDVGILESIVWNLSSPVLINSMVTSLVPALVPFYEGSTYMAAIVGLIPGPIQRNLGMVVEESGALEFRHLMAINDPNMGYGYSYPSEAYMNFGNIGVIVGCFLLGLLFQIAYRLRDRKSSLSSGVYPLLLGYLPYGFRSDSLGQLKTILYTLVIMSLIVFISRWMASRTASKNAVHLLDRNHYRPGRSNVS